VKQLLLKHISLPEREKSRKTLRFSLNGKILRHLWAINDLSFYGLLSLTDEVWIM